MRLKIKFVGFKKSEEVIELKEKLRYTEILENLGINPETVVLIRDSTPLPLDEFAEGGEVTVIRVISGG
ncbi:MAG: MoaD/ThiS family protein [Archaeoglobaceae archaeon]|uniref:MoaD/ThiS family protein n=1 Tax=Archaeoglobus fulgidus TaxID=2234 RepID=A0A7J3M336_ARCFL